MVSGIRDLIGRQTGILSINEVLTMHLGPRDVLANISLDFRGGITSDQVETTITTMEREIKSHFPQVKRVFIEAQGWASHQRSVHALATEAGPEEEQES